MKLRYIVLVAFIVWGAAVVYADFTSIEDLDGPVIRGLFK